MTWREAQSVHEYEGSSQTFTWQNLLDSMGHTVSFLSPPFDSVFTLQFLHLGLNSRLKQQTIVLVSRNWRGSGYPDIQEPLPWTDYSNAVQLFQEKILLIYDVNFPCCNLRPLLLVLSHSDWPVPVFNHPHSKKRFFLYLSGIFCVSVCASCPWAPLRRGRVCFLYSLLPHNVFIYTDDSPPILLFSRRVLKQS